MALVILACSVEPRSVPPAATGLAAPMIVSGAMAEAWADMVMMDPAEAAMLPRGLTYTTTGTLLARMAEAMLVIEVISPPGVFKLQDEHLCAFLLGGLDAAFEIFLRGLGNGPAHGHNQGHGRLSRCLEWLKYEKGQEKKYQ